MRVCTACGGVVGEPGKVYGYAGRWCHCLQDGQTYVLPWQPSSPPAVWPPTKKDTSKFDYERLKRTVQRAVLKPHIRRSQGVWTCQRLSGNTGYGRTPGDAYSHWQAQNRILFGASL